MTIEQLNAHSGNLFVKGSTLRWQPICRHDVNGVIAVTVRCVTQPDRVQYQVGLSDLEAA